MIGAMRTISDFAEVALDVEFLGVAHAAMGQQRGLAGA